MSLPTLSEEVFYWQLVVFVSLPLSFCQIATDFMASAIQYLLEPRLQIARGSKKIKFADSTIAGNETGFKKTNINFLLQFLKELCQTKTQSNLY